MPAILLCFFGDMFIQAWIHQPLEYQFGWVGWTGFLIAILLSATCSTVGEIFVGLDRVWSQIIVVFISGVMLVFGLLLLVPVWHLPGVYFATAFSTIYTLYWSLRNLRRLHIRVSSESN